MEKAPCRIGVVPARDFLRAAEIWDVRIGVYNIRSMAGNAIMNGETRHLTKKKPCARWIVGVQFPKKPLCGASIYSVCDFSRNVNAPKVKCSGCFQDAPFGGAARSGKAACFMQRRGKRDVPAVSRARRRIERLRGVQFCRRALEIRSEDSAPALIRPHGFGGNLGLFIPDVFQFGRAGNGRNFLRRWRSWATAGSARTRLGN